MCGCARAGAHGLSCLFAGSGRAGGHAPPPSTSPPFFSLAPAAAYPASTPAPLLLLTPLKKAGLKLVTANTPPATTVAPTSPASTRGWAAAAGSAQAAPAAAHANADATPRAAPTMTWAGVCRPRRTRSQVCGVEGERSGGE